MERTLLVAASYVVLLRDGQVLLQQRANTGYMDGRWALLAGHVDPGESAEEAAVREAREEAGVEVASLTPLTTLHRLEVGGPQVEQRVDFFYLAGDWTGEPHVREPAKCSAMEWFPLTALPETVVPAEAEVLRRFSAGDLPAIMVMAR